MNEMKVFENEEFGKVRTVMIDDEPWFVGKDISEYFGDTNYRRSLARLDDDEKGVSQIATPGGEQRMTIVNESGLYSLLFYMQPKKAKGVSQNDALINERITKLKKFRHWVTSEVLPSIRKHGLYAPDELLNNLDLLINVATALRDERNRNEKLIKENDAQKKQIEHMQKKADYYDTAMSTNSLISITSIAKNFGMTARQLNEWLREHKVQFKRGSLWLLYKEYDDCGYTSTVTKTRRAISGVTVSYEHTCWTSKGKEFIYNILAKYGIYPIVS